MNITELKKIAAERAVEEIQPGMVVGLGTGSTFQFALEAIAEKLKNGKLFNIVGIPSSYRTELEAKRLGIPLTSFDELIGKNKSEKANSKSDTSENPASGIKYPISRCIDLTIDGADEVAVGNPDPDLSWEGSIDLIKGGGGALLKEKIVVQASKKFFAIVDESKLSEHLGEKFFVPVEVIKFAKEVEENFLQSLGAKTTVRKNDDGSLFITDEGNIIIDANFGGIKNPKELAQILNERAGIVEHGLFVGTTTKVFCSFKNGELKVIEKK